MAKVAGLAEAGVAVTFGITLDCPETGYGYIQQGAALAGESGAFKLARFVENRTGKQLSLIWIRVTSCGIAVFL